MKFRLWVSNKVRVVFIFEARVFVFFFIRVLFRFKVRFGIRTRLTLRLGIDLSLWF